MKLRPKLVLIGVMVVALAIGGALIALGAVARSRGVSRVAVPPGSLIERLSRNSDYADSYAATVPAALFPDTRALDRFAFQRSTAAGETRDEILYRGESSALVYYISYMKGREGTQGKLSQGTQGTLFVSTTVHYKNWRGWLYFAFVRPGHRVLTSFMVSVMIRQAKAEATRLELLRGGATR
jgi:hypothetical protein